MKPLATMQIRLKTVGAVVLSLSFLLAAQAQSEQGTAFVRSIHGSADYSEGGGTWTALESGKILKAGAVIRTAADSYVDLDLRKNGPGLRVTQNTTLGLDKLITEETGVEPVIETQLDLKAGCIAGRVNKTGASSKYEIKTPNSVAGVKGYGEYSMCANGRIVVGQGSAVVVYVSATGQTSTYVVNAGQAFDPAIPGVRQATPEELQDIRIQPPGPTVAVFAPNVEPYVSPISPKDAARGSGVTVTTGNRGD
jgi:FecR protein